MAKLAALAMVNPAFFALRNFVQFRRAGYSESAEEDSAPQPEQRLQTLSGKRARELELHFGLDATLRQRLSTVSWSMTLYYADLLEAAFARAEFARSALLQLAEQNTGPIDALDIGAKNFISSIAIQRVMQGIAPERGVCLSGVEIDGWRILRGWHSRHDMAQYYLSLLPPAAPGRQHAFLPMDFMRLEGQFDFITWFHPLLDAYPLLHWGLPRRLLKPEAMFAQMLARLRPGGIALIVNQEPHEDEFQRSLIADAGSQIMRHVAFEHSSAFSLHQRPGYLHLLQKC